MLILTAALLLFQAPADEAKAADEALEKFKKDYKGSEDDRVNAVKELGKTHHAKVASKLSAVVAGGSPKLKVAAIAALGDFAKAKTQAVNVLNAAIPPNLGEKGVVWAVFDALAALQEPAGVATLVSYFDHKDADLASRAVPAAGKAGSLIAVEPLIAALLKAEKTLKANSSTYSSSNPQSGTSFTYSPDPGVKQRAENMIKAAQQALRLLTKQELSTATEFTEWWAIHKPAPKPNK